MEEGRQPHLTEEEAEAGRDTHLVFSLYISSPGFPILSVHLPPCRPQVNPLHGLPREWSTLGSSEEGSRSAGSSAIYKPKDHVQPMATRVSVRSMCPACGGSRFASQGSDGSGAGASVVTKEQPCRKHSLCSPEQSPLSLNAQGKQGFIRKADPLSSQQNGEELEMQLKSAWPHSQRPTQCPHKVVAVSSPLARRPLLPAPSPSARRQYLHPGL